jgi:hypothetical protein
MTLTFPNRKLSEFTPTKNNKIAKNDKKLKAATKKYTDTNKIRRTLKANATKKIALAILSKKYYRLSF